MENLKKSFAIKLTASSLVIILLLAVTAALALAQSKTRVFLHTVDAADNTLVVDVMAENVTDLYGAEFRVKYDPAVVAVKDVKPDQAGIQIETGDLLPSNQGFVVANETNESEGTVTFAMTLLNPAPPVSGTGPLARISFDKLQNVSSTINVEHAKLVAVDLETIPSQTAMLTISEGDNQTEVVANNSSDTTTAAPVSAPAVSAPAEVSPQPVERGAFPWWIVAAVIMVLGVLVLGGFIVMNGLKTATTLSGAAQETRTINNQPQSSGKRPSAFKNH